MNAISKLLVAFLFPVTAAAGPAMGPGSSGGGAPAPQVEALCTSSIEVPANGYVEELPDGSFAGRRVKVKKNTDGTYRVSGSLSSPGAGMPFYFDFTAKMNERGVLQGKGAINEGKCPWLVELSAQSCSRKASRPYAVSIRTSRWLQTYMYSPHTYDYSCARAIKDRDFGGFEPTSTFSDVYPEGYSAEEREAWLAR